jgi:DNA mismatch repair protein MSH5
MAELDVILAFSTVALELNCVRPEISDEDNVIFVEKGRSPLQAIVTEHRYIPNDVRITDDDNIAMVTGPNYSGKSCYLSMVGVVVYMAHLGCFVPCDRARIGLTDRLLVRISSVETCAVPQSTFQIDLTQMGKILRHSTKKSLVLVDEFGKGTAPMSGMAVLAAAVDKLSTVGCKVVCTTHFLELFSLGLFVDGRGGVKCYKMSVHVPENDKDDPVPLFKLAPGYASSSDGLVCAKMAGLNSSVLARGYAILSAIKNNTGLKKFTKKDGLQALVSEKRRAVVRAFVGVEDGMDWKEASGEQMAELRRLVKELMECY